MTMPREATGRRLEVLRLLRNADEPLGIAELADRLGVHANTVRFHVETLLDHGQIERTAPGRVAPGRPPQRFQAARGMDPMRPRHYRVLAEVFTASLAAEPDPSGQAAEAGRSWGRQQAAAFTNVDTDAPIEATEGARRLVHMLDTLDFAPERLSNGDRPSIGLRHCPFLELATSNSATVCPIHLGLMQGAMDSWGSPVTVERLDPFVEPDLCVAHLGPKGAS